ncbi:choline ABC transporter substrate-binding protein [Burkholderia sp. BCC1999]|uniref:choline ABC transporter substrate-binding protein n=1 Tax=Burkholderia sp. BCC1999 TaxID=2817448 RepID=UPI002AC312A5|nr:choline ABC transporter substrate-binding protein [Burkholderia sp. BCC1999]
MNTSTLWSVCVLAITCSLSAQARDDASCKDPRFAKIGWTDLEATTALAQNVLAGLGYKATDTTLSIPLAWAGLKRKDLDIYLGDWVPSQDSNAKPYLESKSVTRLPKPNLIGAKFTLAVPDYVFDQGLRSFDDIVKFKDKLGGRIYGIEPGDDANVSIQKMIKANAHHLGDFKLMESSEAGMLVSVDRAIARKEWIVFLGWEPHPMNLAHSIKYLSGGDKEFGPNYGAAEVYTVVANGYRERCPNIAKLLDNLEFTTNMEDTIMARIVKKEDPRTVAKEWLKQHPEVLTRWLNGVTTFDGKPANPAVQAYLGK